jgi:hypothetical protein
MLDNATGFAVVTGSTFCLGTSGTGSACVAPTIGDSSVGSAGYVDYIGPNFVVVGSGSSVSQSFSSGSMTGVGAFTISATAAGGATDVGQIVISYDLYGIDPGDPNFNPDTDLIAAGNFATAPASVTIPLTPVRLQSFEVD